MNFRWTGAKRNRSFAAPLLCLGLVGFLPAAACSSQTAKKLEEFADKVCSCKDAACAEKVQDEYLAWAMENRRARGSDSDRKEIEEVLERYSECHQKLVNAEGKAGADAEVVVPKVDLEPPAQ